MTSSLLVGTILFVFGCRFLVSPEPPEGTVRFEVRTGTLGARASAVADDEAVLAARVFGWNGSAVTAPIVLSRSAPGEPWTGSAVLDGGNFRFHAWAYTAAPVGPVAYYGVSAEVTIGGAGGTNSVSITTADIDSVSIGSIEPAIGPAGGFIFSKDEGNEHNWFFLEAAPVSTEWSGTTWGDPGTTVGGTGTPIGTGAHNTAAVVAAYGECEPGGGCDDYAAGLCAALSHNDYADWFLPSEDELRAVYENLHRAGAGGFASGPGTTRYWSSSESGSTDARSVDFADGAGGAAADSPKSEEYRVRAVRAVSSRPPGLPVDTGAGTMLVRHGWYVYRIGGVDQAGAVTDAVFAARVDAQGAVEGSWFETARLPRPLSHGAAFGAANFVYVIGGRTADGGLNDRVYYAYAQEDTGRLGFGEDGRWDVNGRRLPYGVARTAWALHDGHLYLAGGDTDLGHTDAIIYARLYRDGHVGYWYGALQSLGSAVSTAAAATIDQTAGGAWLVVAGGEAEGVPTDELHRFTIGAHGVLSDRQTGRLPIAVSGPVLLYDSDRIVMAGGYQAGGVSAAVHRWNGSEWTQVQGVSAAAEGPTHGRAGGALLYLRRPDEAHAVDVRSIALGLAPEAPQVLPTSGPVEQQTYVRVRSEPGSVLRYRVRSSGEVTEVTESDAEWSPGLRINDDMAIGFRAFGASGGVSPLTRRSYQVRSTGFFLHTERIPVHASAPEELPPLAPGWYFFDLAQPETVTVRWKDAETEDAEATALVRLSVYEPDLFTPVPDKRSGAPVLELASAASPALMRMPAGRFYLQAEQLGEEGVFLIAVSTDEPES